jgi:DNA-binding MarR family transcriptional regulator
VSRATPLHPSDSPGFLLWHATLRWQRDIARALAPLDLTHVQFVLLACTWWLNEQGSQPNQVAVAAQAGTDIKMTSQVLRSLERKSLIERLIDSADTRARRVRVTKQGARLAPRAIAIVEEVDARFFADLPAPEALRLLRRLAKFPGAELEGGANAVTAETFTGNRPRTLTRRRNGHA